jgi:phage shock protein PspC (stress-responsive transcriptional regulator)
MTPLIGMFGFFEIVVYAAVAAIVLPALLSAWPSRPGPRCRGGSWRLARRQGLPVLAVRILAVAAILLSGIGPGLCLYLLLGCVLPATQDRF